MQYNQPNFHFFLTMEGLDKSLHSLPCILLRSRSLLFLLQLQAAPSYMYEKERRKRKIKLHVFALY